MSMRLAFRAHCERLQIPSGPWTGPAGPESTRVTVQGLGCVEFIGFSVMGTQ